MSHRPRCHSETRFSLIQRILPDNQTVYHASNQIRRYNHTRKLIYFDSGGEVRHTLFKAIGGVAYQLV